MRTIIVSDALFVFVHQIEDADADGMWPAAPVSSAPEAKECECDDYDYDYYNDSSIQGRRWSEVGSESSVGVVVVS